CGSMIGLNVLYLLIWIPAIIWTFIHIVQLNLIMSKGDFIIADLFGLLYSYLLVMFPLTAITGPFTAGASYVMRNWARDEHSFVWADFKHGMKQNWKQALAYSVIDGAFPLIAFLCIYFYTGMAGGSMLFYLPMAVIVIVYVLWSLVKMAIPPMIVSYKLKFGQVIKNSILITLTALPKAILAKLITLIVPILLALFNLFIPGAASWATAIGIALYAILMLSFNRLVIASYANAAFEKYINPMIDGAQMDIGLQSRRNARDNTENEDKK
ncbi:MAG: YesL family protein, partial [Clostridia bacterium]|nr:YesL family protein [Clostridia bacterium]